jgi:hypothetical protein
MFFAVANLLASSLGHKAESAKNGQLRQGAAMGAVFIGRVRRAEPLTGSENKKAGGLPAGSKSSGS